MEVPAEKKYLLLKLEKKNSILKDSALIENKINPRYTVYGSLISHSYVGCLQCVIHWLSTSKPKKSCYVVFETLTMLSSTLQHKVLRSTLEYQCSVVSKEVYHMCW